MGTLLSGGRGATRPSLRVSGRESPDAGVSGGKAPQSASPARQRAGAHPTGGRLGGIRKGGRGSRSYSRLASPLSAKKRALHARPIIEATSADFDIREDSGCLPVAQSPAADWQPRQQSLFVNETRLTRRPSGRKIYLLAVHVFALHLNHGETLAEPRKARVYLIHKRACFHRHYQRRKVERVSTGFTNSVHGARILSFTKIETLAHSRALTYRFLRVQALPLVWTRFSRPRTSRGFVAECPRHSPASRPWPCPVRDRVQSENSPCPRPDRARSQSATMSGPCPQTYPCPVRIRAKVHSGSA